MFPNLKQPVADAPATAGATVQGEFYRFTVLTDRLIRLEYDIQGRFEDRPTQVVNNRLFPQAEFVLTERGQDIQIRTDHFELHYRKGPFTRNSLTIDKLGAYSNHDNIWRFGEVPSTLKGTGRTLDKADGAIPLEEGLCARTGFSILDDSRSLVITEDGWIAPRRDGVVDLYYFGYGHDYLTCVQDFYRLTGAPPLLPRYALGNWWSRYYAYTQQEYMDLITRFSSENLPFSVAVIDMDWHTVPTEERYGRGWTGYTWNRQLYPDPKGLLDWLHDHNLKVTLNLHPADGVKGHEEMYRPMAEALGVDWEKEDPIPFDISSPQFMEAYFGFLHHPLEEQGVDFWWIDWQSGGVSRVEGLDPLWMLNHYHSLDIARNGKRPLTFSRYSGPGSHRYPVGFSGDSVISWESLEFQPYFTATSTNIGYCWWSHDIGGHMQGIKDDELVARWVQFGVFSPINRLHSSNSPFGSKEPWNYGPVANDAMGKALRLRHRLLPYLYSQNWRCATSLQPLIQPMYYSHPQCAEAYLHPNQYWFGSELMVAAITRKSCEQTLRGAVDVWLPEGQWYDFFTGAAYTGGKQIRVHRKLDEYPVFAKAGAVVPLAELKAHDNAVGNPEEVEVLIFPGADGSYSLYEDAGDGDGWKSGAYVQTNIVVRQSCSQLDISIRCQGDSAVLPPNRRYKLLLRGFQPDNLAVSAPCETGYNPDDNTIWIRLGPSMENELRVTGLSSIAPTTNLEHRLMGLLAEMQISNPLKEVVAQAIQSATDSLQLVSTIHTAVHDPEVLSALLELICA